MVSPDFEFVQRHVGLTDDDFLFEIDEYKKATGEQFLLAHIRVDRWSLSVCKRIRAQWRVLRQFVTTPLFAVPKDDDARWHKFVSMLGFKPLHQVTCNNGAQRPIYVSL
jgi:hypothetical protein